MLHVSHPGTATQLRQLAWMVSSKHRACKTFTIYLNQILVLFLYPQVNFFQPIFPPGGLEWCFSDICADGNKFCSSRVFSDCRSIWNAADTQRSSTSVFQSVALHDFKDTNLISYCWFALILRKPYKSHTKAVILIVFSAFQSASGAFSHRQPLCALISVCLLWGPYPVTAAVLKQKVILLHKLQKVETQESKSPTNMPGPCNYLTTEGLKKAGLPHVTERRWEGKEMWQQPSLPGILLPKTLHCS